MLQNQSDQLMAGGAGGKEAANAMALMNDFLKDNSIGGPKMAKGGAGFAKNRMQSGRKPPSIAAETPMQ